MSVNTEQNLPDPSTQGANWGTIVMLLCVMIIAVVVAWTVYKGGQTPSLNAAPVLSNPAAVSPMPTQPAPRTALPTTNG